MKTVRKLIVIASLLACSVCGAFAQQITKFAVVDTSRVYQSYYRDSVQVRNFERKRQEFKDEVARITAEIQQMRFSQRIDLQWKIEPERFHDLKVPKLILQPLIENAFEHGLRRVLEGGIIRVSLDDTDGVVIHVEDNGQSLTDERLEELATRLRQNKHQDGEDSVALLNIHRRLQILFGSQSGLTVSRSDLGGMKTTVTIRGEMIDV